MTARLDSSELSYRLSQQAEAVCRHYLSAGKRQGQYWLIGDVRNTPGRSLFVRLVTTPKGSAGKWTDAATGEHGDLLDIIRESCALTDFADVIEEARRFLSLPSPEPSPSRRKAKERPVTYGTSEAARRLVQISHPIAGTLAETYLRTRGITDLRDTENLRFHPRCYYRPDDHSPTVIHPALIAIVTDLSGQITGAHRTWLAHDGMGKAPVDTPRKAMGHLMGHAVRFGVADDVLAAGEGIETVLSLRQVLPHIPMLAALSAAHLPAIALPDTLRRLYVMRDNDPPGNSACHSLCERAKRAGIEAMVLTPIREDFNEDLRHLGAKTLWDAVRSQLAPEDIPHLIR